MLNYQMRLSLFALALALALASSHAFHIQERRNSRLGRQNTAAYALLSKSPQKKTLVSLWMAGGEGPDDNTKSKSPLDRVLSPQIDDKGLPLSDAFAAQIIGPSLQVFWLTLVRAPSPTWLKPIFDDTLWQYRGALLAPTLVHGSALSVCWLLGALVARAYEEEAIDPTIGGYKTVLFRIFQAGCFASGCLIFATQLDLLIEFGGYVQPGESPETDARILTAWVEVLNDIFFEVLTLVPIRLFLAASIAKNK